jgi:predicted secreted Zn-dependent protease
MLALAVLLIVGGGAGWKFWQRMSEQRHEQAMAKLAIDREMAGLQGAQPPPCQTATAKMQREIDALEKRLGKVERRASPALPADFDADDLIARVEKLEKAKAPTRASSARG